MYEGDRKSVNKCGVLMNNAKLEDDVTLGQIKDEYSEAVDIFPALHKYQSEHSTVNLQKLCVEVTDFCRAIYASTQNDSEREIYFNMAEKIQNCRKPS